MKVLFIHRSVGHNLIVDGNVYKLLGQQHPNILLSDYDQNSDILINSNAQRKLCKFTFPNNDTKPASYAAIFSDNASKEYISVRDFALEFDAVIIKSCYPNSNIKSDSELEAIKQQYRSIAAFFDKERNKKLLILTSPPLVPLMTNPRRAKRARKLADWLAAAELGKNVTVYNFYSELADAKWNWLKRSYRRRLPVDSHPNQLASQTIAPRFIEHIASLA